MKVITKCVNIENEEFVLVKFTDVNNREWFGTIPYTELNEKGQMKRPLNGFEMCIAETIAQALDRRIDMVKTHGYTLEQMIKYFTNKTSIAK